MLCCSVGVSAQRIVTFDWTVAETLMALEHPPVGVAQITDYQSWVSQPPLPSQTIDLGLRHQPSRELLLAVRPDLIVLTPMFATMAPELEHIAPVHMLVQGDSSAGTWEGLLHWTQQLGELTGKSAEAETLIQTTQEKIRMIKKNLPTCQPLLVMQLVDERHVRVYGGGSVYQQVLELLGLQNAWQGAVNRWGYRLVSLHELAHTQGQTIIIQPNPFGAWEKLQANSFWRQLPVVQSSPLLFEPIWSLGGLPSALRFAELIVQSGACDE